MIRLNTSFDSYDTERIMVLMGKGTLRTSTLFHYLLSVFLTNRAAMRLQGGLSISIYVITFCEQSQSSGCQGR